MSATENQEDTTNTDAETEPDNVDVGLVGTITVVGALLVVSIAMALTALVRVEQSRVGEEAGAFANLGAVARLKAEQNDRLNAAPKWADKAQGLVSIPIDRAMTLVSEDISRNPMLATPMPPGEEPADAGAEAGAPDAGGGEPSSADTPSQPETPTGGVPGTPEPAPTPDQSATGGGATPAPKAPAPAPKAAGGAPANAPKAAGGAPAKAPNAPPAPRPTGAAQPKAPGGQE